jgi:hypothetical protein
MCWEARVGTEAIRSRLLFKANIVEGCSTQTLVENTIRFRILESSAVIQKRIVPTHI